MPDEIERLLAESARIFEAEGNLVELTSGRAVFVGDTHGDLDATERVIDRYLRPGCMLVLLGDYVDRGPHSAQNLHTLLRLKIEHPQKVFLLAGNHEGQQAIEFYPADFWHSLDSQMRKRYAAMLAKLPLMASAPNGIIAAHGALPDVDTLEDVRRIEFGSKHWRQITWGDWDEDEPGDFAESLFPIRPRFGRSWFDRIMQKLGKNVLIRSHQPDVRPVIFERQCLTIFTSDAYRSIAGKRTVAIADLDKEIKTVDDLQIEVI